MAAIRVFLGFAQASDHVLEETTGYVMAGIYVNASVTFPTPPVLQPALQTALTNFTDAIAAQQTGGKAATAAKQVARDALIGLLRQLALYVQQVVGKIADPAAAMAALLSSGFDAVSTNRAQHPLATPNIIGIENTGTGSLTLRLKPVPNARNYEVQHQIAGGPWVSAGLFQSTRGMAVTGLTAGANYTFQVRAIGGSTGQSDWSNPVSHMSL